VNEPSIQWSFDRYASNNETALQQGLSVSGESADFSTFYLLDDSIANEVPFQLILKILTIIPHIAPK